MYLCYHGSVVTFDKNLSKGLENFLGLLPRFSGQPVNMGIFAEPGQLPLGIMAGGLLDLGASAFQSAVSCQIINKFLVANGLHSGGLWGNTHPEKVFDFLQQSQFQHFIYPTVDPALKILPVFILQGKPGSFKTGRDRLGF